MLKKSDRIFPNLVSKLPPTLNNATKNGDWVGLDSLLASHSRQQIIEKVKLACLRGRGGAGFPTALKWSFIPTDDSKPHYLIINADESEPGTCKDRAIITWEPHKIIEGAIFAAKAIGAQVGYIYIRGEFYHESFLLQKAIDEAYYAGFLGNSACKNGKNFNLYLHCGAGAYICGEETALLESLEGKRGLPRLKPPFPATQGLYGCPTVINNIESIANISSIIKRGPEWFASLGVKDNGGSKVFCISGMVHNPCVVEECMGVSMKYLIQEYAKDVIGGWNNLKAVIPGGSSCPLLPAALAQEAKMDFDSLKTLGSALGTGGVIVMNKEVDIVFAIARLSRFYMEESCGQCSPCREGTGWMYRIMQKITLGQAKRCEIDELLEITHQVEGNTICALGDASAWPIQGLIKHFREELEARCVE